MSGGRSAQDRLESWCLRHIPTLSRRFLKYGRDGILGPLFAFLALGSFGRWWDWSHVGGPMSSAVGWTVAAAVVLVLARRVVGRWGLPARVGWRASLLSLPS